MAADAPSSVESTAALSARTALDSDASSVLAFVRLT